MELTLVEVCAGIEFSLGFAMDKLFSSTDQALPSHIVDEACKK